MATTTIAEGIKKVLGKYGSLIEQYRGEIPAAVVAARIWHETRGNSCPPPTPCCDERGLLQLWKSTREKYGVTNACDPAQALRGGCAHWIDQANKLRSWLSTTGYGVPAGYEFWSLAYLYTAIGAGATKALIKASGSSLFTNLANWVAANANGALLTMAKSFGTQKPAAIATRTANTAKYVGTAYQVGGGGNGIMIAGLAAALIWFWWRKRP